MSQEPCSTCELSIEYRVKSTENRWQQVFELCSERYSQLAKASQQSHFGKPEDSKAVIVEGLAQRLMSQHVSETQLNKRVAEMNANVPTIEWKYCNRFEERIKQVRAEIEKDAQMLRWSTALNL